MKKLFLLLASGIILAACGGPAQEQQQAEETIHDHAIRVLVENPMDYEGKTVRFEGILDHMCRHSGDKMRVAQMDDSEFSIQILLGDYMNQFNTDMEGSMLSVVGTMHTEVMNMEELEAHDHDHGCESTEAAVAMMEEHGIDPSIRPYVKLKGFEVR